MPSHFGADDNPVCPECTNRMCLTRRTPHPTHGYDFELQTFACRVCKHEIQREADYKGAITSHHDQAEMAPSALR